MIITPYFSKFLTSSALSRQLLTLTSNPGALWFIQTQPVLSLRQWLQSVAGVSFPWFFGSIFIFSMMIFLFFILYLYLYFSFLFWLEVLFLFGVWFLLKCYWEISRSAFVNSYVGFPMNLVVDIFAVKIN